jgi:hypothetical protein
MATSPAFAATPHTSAALITGTETDLAVPTAAVSVFAGGTNGSKIEEVVITAYFTTLVASTAAGLVYLWLYNGTTYFVWDVLVVAAITPSTTTAGFRLSKPYNNLFVPSGWTLYAGQSVAANASHLIVTAQGADL